MTFGEAIESGFFNYFNFHGRARRSEYWYFFLFTFLITIAVTFLVYSLQWSKWVAYLIVAPLSIPHWAVSVRRLHDTGKSGMWVLASSVLSFLSNLFAFLAIPDLILSIVMLVWECTDGESGDNKYGPDPKLY